MLNLDRELKESVMLRKIAKEEFDKRVNLANVAQTDDGYFLLLDEGLQTWSDGSPRFYLKKGALSAYVENLADDFEGVINLGHMEYAVFPFVLGTWSKKDLRLVDAGNGRQALYVKPHLDYDSAHIKELARQGREIGLSAEFVYSIDEKATEELGVRVYESIDIDGIGIVGDCGAVNAYGIKLKGEKQMIDVQKLAETSTNTSLEQLSNKIDEILSSDGGEENAPEVEQKEAVEPAPEEGEDKDDVPFEEDKPEEEKPAEEPSESVMASVLKKLEELDATVKRLEGEKEALSAQLKDKEAMEKDFVEKFQKFSVSLAATGRSETQNAAEAVTEVYTDGVGA